MAESPKQRAWRNRGYDDGIARKDKNPPGKHDVVGRRAYLGGYARGEQEREKRAS